MKNRLMISLLMAGLTVVLATGLAVGRAQTVSPVAERHPAIRRAITALEEAKAYLRKADHDFGGHRKAALEECDKAIEQLKLALEYDRH